MSRVYEWEEDLEWSEDRDLGLYDDEEDETGTSLCNGLCVPQCEWCQVSHNCPTECTDAGRECPYEVLRAREEAEGAESGEVA